MQCSLTKMLLIPWQLVFPRCFQWKLYIIHCHIHSKTFGKIQKATTIKYTMCCVYLILYTLVCELNGYVYVYSMLSLRLKPSNINIYIMISPSQSLISNMDSCSIPLSLADSFVFKCCTGNCCLCLGCCSANSLSCHRLCQADIYPFFLFPS